MSPTMILVLALISVPLTAQDPGAGRLERLTKYAQELGFEVEEVWTARDGRISIRLRPGPPPAPPAMEAPPEPPVIDADAGSYMEALTRTVQKFGVAEKVRIGPPRVRGSKDGATTAIRIDFLMKEGYHFDDVVRLLQAIEDQHPRARLRSLDLGKRDPGPSIEVWRPTLAEFALEPEPQGVSALVHLGQLNGAAERLRSDEVEVILDRFRADDRGLKWDMTVRAAALPAELFATIGASLPGGAVLPGRISSPGAGIWDISGSSITFPPADPGGPFPRNPEPLGTAAVRCLVERIMGLRIGRKLNLLMAGVGLLALAAGGYLVSEPGRDAAPPLEPAAGIGPASPGTATAVPKLSVPTPAPAAGTIETEPFDVRRNLESALGALIDPDFGPLVERGEARVEIAVVDALGQPLDPMGWSRNTAHRVWRREGEHWQSAPSEWDIGCLVAGGGPGAGLEPGDHEAVLSLGSYGVGRIDFRVGRGESARLALRMPGWRRVVTLRFVDPEGRPIPYLGAPPRFSAAASAPLPDRPKAPGVLRDPPHRNTWIGFGGGCSSRWSCRERRGKLCYPTDEGRYSVPVIAGVAGQIHLRIDPLLFLDTDAPPLESDFSGAEWDDYVIPLRPRPDYAESVAVWRKIQPDDPGRRWQARRWPPPRSATPHPSIADPFDLATISRNRSRIVAKVDGPRGCYPVVCRGNRIQEILRERAVDSMPHTDMKPQSGLDVVLADGAFYWGTPHRVEVPGKQELVRVDLEEAPLPCSLSVRATPTLAAWTRAVSFALSSDDPGLAFSSAVQRDARPALRDGDWHRYETFLSDAWRQAIDRSATLHMGYAGKAGSTLGYDAKGEVRLTGSLQYFTLRLDRGQRDMLLNGRLALDLRQEIARTRPHPILAFRCVGDRDEGIPWVEASIVPAEDDALARAMRHASRRLAGRSRRPSADRLVAAACKPAPPSVEEPEEEIEEELEEPIIEEVDDEEIVGSSFVEIVDAAGERIPPLPGRDLLERVLGPEIIAAYGEPGVRRLWTQGAWYDTHRKLKSDADGYVISDSQRLVPGRAYVLYLWSYSRDDLHPDRRVVFEATPGITDLGILRLPSH